MIAFGEDAAGGAHLDEIGSILDDLAHLGAGGPGTIGDRFGFMFEFGGEQIVIAMPAGDAQGRAGDEHTWAGHIALGDRIAKGDICVAGSPQVAHGRESRLKRPPRVGGTVKRLARHGDAQGPIPRMLRIRRQMHVHINEPGQHRQAVEIQHGCPPGSMREHDLSRAHCLNAISFDEERVIREQASLSDVQERASLENKERGSGRRCRRRAPIHGGREDHQRKQQKRSHVSHPSPSR